MPRSCVEDKVCAGGGVPGEGGAFSTRSTVIDASTVSYLTFATCFLYFLDTCGTNDQDRKRSTCAGGLPRRQVEAADERLVLGVLLVRPSYHCGTCVTVCVYVCECLYVFIKLQAGCPGSSEVPCNPLTR